MTAVNGEQAAQSRIVRVVARITAALAVTAAALTLAPQAGAQAADLAPSIEAGAPASVMTDPSDWPWLLPKPR